MIFQAKSDVRYYLNGVFISRKHIYATNGHMAIRMEHGSKVRSGVIVKVKHAIPAKAKTTTLHLLGKKSYAEHIDAFGRILSMGAIEIIDGRYPDIDKLISIAKEKPAGTQMPSINPLYLQAACKAIDCSGSKFPSITCKIPENASDAVLYTTKDALCNEWLGNPEILIMPVRVD